MKRIRRSLSRILAHASLRITAARLRIRAPIPTSDWAIGADDLHIILDAIRAYAQNGRASILEFGSGISTFALMSAARHFDSLELTTIEADPTWAAWVRRGISTLRHKPPFSLRAEILHMPALNASIFNPSEFDNEPWGNAKYDLIFIDAPPDNTRPNARLELAIFAMPLLKSMGSMLIHDTNRIQERFLVESLRDHFMVTEVHETRKGISVLRFPRRK